MDAVKHAFAQLTSESEMKKLVRELKERNAEYSEEEDEMDESKDIPLTTQEFAENASQYNKTESKKSEWSYQSVAQRQNEQAVDKET